MTDMYHDEEAIGSIHIPHDLEYADQTARLAGSGLLARHVGRLAKQLDDGSYWVLTAISPVTWAAFVPPTPAVADIGRVLGVITDGASDILLDWVGGTPSANNVLTFDGTDATWAQLSHTVLSGIGSNTHGQIDTAVSNSVSHISATTAHGATGAVVGTTNVQTLSDKTLTTPTIGDLTNANHTHLNAAGGGTLSLSAVGIDQNVNSG